MECIQQEPSKVIVCEAFGWNFKSELIILEKSSNTEYYIDIIILESTFLNDADTPWRIGQWISQENSKTPLRSDALAVLKEYRIETLVDWLSYTPDLNIIGIVWAIMKTRVETYITNPDSSLLLA